MWTSFKPYEGKNSGDGQRKVKLSYEKVMKEEKMNNGCGENV